jgi:hypothetical protein
LLGFAESEAGAELEDACGEGVLRREGECIEAYDFGVLALVEGIVDVDEFCCWGVSAFDGGIEEE